MGKKIAFCGLCSTVIMCMAATGAFAEQRVLGSIIVPSPQPGCGVSVSKDRITTTNNKAATKITMKNACTDAILQEFEIEDPENGTPGADCNAKIETVRCGAGESVACGDTTKTGTKTTTYKCDGTTVESTAYTYDGAGGANGAACNAKIETVRCGAGESVACGDTTKTGTKTTTYKCDGTTVESTAYTYDGAGGANGADCNAKIETVRCGAGESVACGDTTKTGTKTTTYKCDGTTVESTAYTYDGAGGATGKDYDPCEGVNANSTTIVRSTSSTGYDRGTKTNGVYSQIGGQTVTKTMCSGTQVSYVQDTCIEIAKPSGVCAGDSNAYLQCKNPSQTTDPTYYVCQSLGSGNDSLAAKIAGKADQSDLNTLSNTVAGKASASDLSNLQAEVSKKANSSDLDDYVKTDGTNLPSGVITTSNINTAIADKSVSFGGRNMTLGDVVNLLSSAVTCSASTVDGETTTTCTGNGLTLQTATRDN